MIAKYVWAGNFLINLDKVLYFETNWRGNNAISIHFENGDTLLIEIDENANDLMDDLAELSQWIPDK